MQSDSVKELVNLIKKRKYNKNIKDYVLLVCDNDNYVNAMLGFLRTNPNATENEIIEKIFVIIPPQLFFIGDLTKENYIKYKTHYIQDFIKLYDKNDNEASKKLKDWTYKYLFECSLDKEWEDSSNTLIVVELQDIIWFYNKCHNKAVIEIIDTDDIKDIKSYINKPLCMVMIYLKDRKTPFNSLSVLDDMNNNIFILNFNENISQKYQIGILYPVKD